jgi:predicted porin
MTFKQHVLGGIMQKKLIALAVAGVLAAPAAMASDVTVYGKARLSFGVIGNDANTSGTNMDNSKLAISSHASRLGFKGSDDLGNGMTAVWQIERSVDFTDKSSTLGVRNTFAGLKGDFGTVLLGTHDTPYKISTGKLDPFGDTFADYNSIIGTAHDQRSRNVLAYISPDMSGFTLAAAYVTDFVDDNISDSLPEANPAFSLAGMYSNGPLYATVAYQSVAEYSGAALNGKTIAGTTISEVCTATNDKCGDATAAKLGVGYEIAQFNLGLAYETTSLDTTSAGTVGGETIKQNSVYVSGVMDLGSDMKLKAAVGQKDDLDVGGTVKDTGANFYALGLSKNMSSNTELYALYTSVANGKNAGSTASNLGAGNQGITAAGKAGSDLTATALVVGINLKFSSM